MVIRQMEEQPDGIHNSPTDIAKLLHQDMPAVIKNVLHDFKDIFPEDLPLGLPPVRMGHEFKIDLEDDTPPVHKPVYKLSPLELEEARKQIDYMLEHGYIRPSNSPYGSPVLFVPKKDGGLRFCIDHPMAEQKDDPESISSTTSRGTF